MQEITKKKLDLHLFDFTLDHTLSLGIIPTVSFITGYPQETAADQDDTLDLIGRCYTKNTGAELNVQLHLLTPEPGTALLNQFGDEMEFDNHVTDFNFPTLEEDDLRIMLENRNVFMNHHYFKSVVCRKKNIFVTTLFDVLQPLGKLVIGQLVKEFSNSMSKMVRVSFEWFSSKEKFPQISIEDFLVFVDAQLGKGSLIWSLCNYMYTLFKMGNEPYEVHNDILNSNSVELPAKVRYRLAHEITIIRDTHNCPEIINCLQATGKVKTILKNYKTNLVLQLFSNDQSNKVIRNFTIDSTVVDTIDLLAEGKTKGVNRKLYNHLKKVGWIYKDASENYNTI